MTVETVPLIITRIATSQSKPIHLNNLEAKLIQITTCSAQEEIVSMLEALDDALHVDIYSPANLRPWCS